MSQTKLRLAKEALRVLDPQESDVVNGAVSLRCDPSVSYYCTATDMYTRCWSQRCIP